MPWKGLYASQSASDVELRRRSTMDVVRASKLFPAIDEAQSSDPPAIPRHLERSITSAAMDNRTRNGNGNEYGIDNNDRVLPSLDTQQQLPNQKRFSLLKFKHASDPQLSASYNRDETPPPLPTPAIITTSPTSDSLDRPVKKKQKHKLLARSKGVPERDPAIRNTFNRSLSKRSSIFGTLHRNFAEEHSMSTPNVRQSSHITFDAPNEPGRLSTASARGAPPAYGDESNSALAVPISRLSESSRSDRSSSDQIAYATTTTTHTISTTTTFFRLPRRKKEKSHLFPLPLKTSTPEISNTTSQGSLSCENSESHRHSQADSFHINFGVAGSPNGSQLPSPTPSALAVTSIGFAGPAAPLIRQGSKSSVRSAMSSSNLAPSSRLSRTGRSSTMGSGICNLDGGHSARTSTSTTGRKSFGDLFSLSHRFKPGSDPSSSRHSAGNIPPGTPGSTQSKPNSFSLNREPEPISYPEREEGDTPGKYLDRLQEAVPRSLLAGILSKSADEFHRNSLRSYMRKFSFFGDPMDMSIRKLLMEVELPKETQQIDRVIQGFADRYHECNPGIFSSSDQAYYIAFSLLILHTDVFNKNNKRKMQKADYVKNTAPDGIANDILECFYDNISYTPFIHVDDEVDIRGDRHSSKSRKGIFKPGNIKVVNTERLRSSSKEPVDPYTLIMENKLDALRPTLKDVMTLEDPYNYLGTADRLDISQLHAAFLKCGVLQIKSQRSRPDAFVSQAGISNPLQSQPGVVGLKIAKVGLLWRKDPKKRRTRSPWQKWGAVLTGLQLYFFRDTNWVESLVRQYETHFKYQNDQGPVIFSPQLESFVPDNQTSTDDAVALVDSSYRKHKHAFVVFRHGGFEETFLADTEGDMNDWLAKLNYAAAFRTAGVRIRGSVGRGYDNDDHPPESTMTSVSTPTGDVSIRTGKIDSEQAQEIMAQRRQLMSEKIYEADERLETAHRQLDLQLRNARHLQVLSPILPKTREQILMAAGRMSAKLKWVRMEIWRLKCHKCILQMDLNQETKDIQNHPALLRNLSSAAISATSHPNSSRPTLGKIDSRADKSIKSSRHTSITYPPNMDGSLLDAKSPDETSSAGPSRQPSRHSTNKSWDLPTMAFSPHQSFSGPIPPRSPTSPRLAPQKSSLSLRSRSDQASVRNTSRLATPNQNVDHTQNVDQDEQRFLEENKLIDATEAKPIAQRPDTADSDHERLVVSPEPDNTDGRTKVRRSLHKTLRDSTISSHSGHHRSRKGKDSASSAGVTEDASSVAGSEGLPRTGRSFTVHGKKASVVNFGSEWQSMSPEERLKLRKQAQGEDGRMKFTSAIDDISDAASADFSDRPRPTSRLSTSTMTTARSMQQPDDYIRDNGTLGSRPISQGQRSASTMTTAKSQLDDDDASTIGSGSGGSQSVNDEHKSSNGIDARIAEITPVDTSIDARHSIDMESPKGTTYQHHEADPTPA